MSYAWKSGPSDPTERYVFVAIADCANDEGSAFPSLPTIASKTCLSLSTVRRSIASMESIGWLSVVRGKGAGKRSQYQLKRVSTCNLLGEEEKVSQRNLSPRKVSQRKVSRRRKKGVTVTNPPYPLLGVTVNEPSSLPDVARHNEFKADFDKAFKHWNSVPAPWDGKEANQLSRWLKANPTISREQWQGILRNRGKSPVAKAAPLSAWIGTALSWLNGEAGDFGKPVNGNGHRPDPMVGMTFVNGSKRDEKEDRAQWESMSESWKKAHPWTGALDVGTR